MVLNLGPLGKGKKYLPPLYTYTGSCEYHEDAAGTGGTVNWQLVFLSSGTLNFQRVVDSIDVFIVDGGSNGDPGYSVSTTAHGGNGGDGGRAKTHSAVAVATGMNYQITVGAANGGSSGAFDKSTSGGTKKSGGTGASAADNNPYPAASGENGTLSFDGAGDRSGYYPNYRYGASGGGGGAKSPNGTIAASGSGGSNGGGAGGAYNASGSAASSNNSGAGGGGGGMEISGGSYIDQPGGNGRSGIVIIRNAR